MKSMRASVLMLFAASLALASGCATRQSKMGPGEPPRVVRGVPLATNVTCSDADCRAYQTVPAIRTQSKYGIGCMGNTPPGTTPNPEAPPQSYLVSDVGRSGFPNLRPRERALLARLRKAHDSPTLRIAWIDYASTAHNFIVFDATDGPCEVWAAGYRVLNGACNEYYEPGENPYQTHAATGCYPPPK